MALTKCVYCGKEISTRAAACPHCGCPLMAQQQMPLPSNGPAADPPSPGATPPADSEQPASEKERAAVQTRACAYCGRDNPVEAVQCQECGTTEFKVVERQPPPAVAPGPRAAASAPASTPLPAKGQPVQWWMGCLGVIAVCLVGGWLANVAGIFGDTVATPEQAHSITKAEWRKKLESRYGQYAHLNIVYQWKADDFKQFMGNPSSTQNVGDETFWYYDCSDGQIQLVMDQGNLAIGIMAGKINDY